MSDDLTRDLDELDLKLLELIKDLENHGVDSTTVASFSLLTGYFLAKKVNDTMSLEDVRADTGVDMVMIRKYIRFLKHLKKVVHKMDINPNATLGSVSMVVEDG